mmetsp:Transcript_64828/g.127287  ORF Transcript_64828/g.127287 Transcript_64828/m.127287 type:complete len:381 (-) Transcript_64828:2470-3612(-)
MAKMMLRATRAFCPPESCDMRYTSPLGVNDTLTCTPSKSCTIKDAAEAAAAPFAFFFPPAARDEEPLPSLSPSSCAAPPSSRSADVRMMSWPRPSGTSSLNTSLKCFDTPLKVRKMASSFCKSRASMSSSMASEPLSSSVRRPKRASRCSLKFTYWSSAFLFTWLYLVSSWFTLCSFFINSFTPSCVCSSSSAAGKEPSCWILRKFSSRFCVSIDRLFSCFSVCFSTSASTSALFASCACSSPSPALATRTASLRSPARLSSERSCSATPSEERRTDTSSALFFANASARSPTSASPPKPSPPEDESFSVTSARCRSRLSLSRLCSRCRSTEASSSSLAAVSSSSASSDAEALSLVSVERSAAERVCCRGVPISARKESA